MLSLKLFRFLGERKKIIKDITIWSVIFATIIWSIGLPVTMLILPASAATNVNVGTTGLTNASPNAPIKASSAATAIARVQIFTDQSAQNLNAITVNFSGTGFAASDLAALATGNTSGVALYNDSAGNPGSAITLNLPSWSSGNVTLAAATPVALTQSATSTFYIVIKTSAGAVNGHQIIATIPADSVIVESTPVGPAAPFSANNLVVDTAAPTIVKAEKAGPQAVDVTFSESVQTTAATATSTYALSDGLAVMSASQQGPSTFRVMANNNITAASTTITVSNAVLDAAGNVNASTTAVTVTAENRVKISEILVGAAGAATKEFVELYNGGDAPVNLQTSGYKLHIRNAAGDTDTNISLTFATSSIPAFGYFLIASSQYNDIGLTPDATYDATAASLVDNGGAYISTSATAATNVIDMVGWGTQPSGGYESMAATSTSAGQSLERKAFGNSTQTDMASGGVDEGMGNGWDTNNNSFDFLVKTTQQPQNSAMVEQQNFSGYAGPAGSGPMIFHMPLNIAPTSSDLNILTQIGDPQTPIDQISAQLLYMVGDGSPANNTTSNYASVAGSHQGNGYFRFTVPQATVDGSTANGLYYYFKVTTNGGTRYMSASPSADSGGVESTVAQNPFVVTCQSAAGWTKHNITGTVKDQSNTAISGALVFLEGTGYNTTTAGDGTFTLSNVKDSNYNLVIVKTDYYEGWFNNIFLNGANFNIGNYSMSSGTGGGMTGDSTKPNVKWTGPNDGMFGIPPKQSGFKIFIGFSKDMDSSTINNTNIYLTVDGSTASSSSVTYDNNPNDNAAAGLPPDNYLGIVGTPAGGFMPNTTYYLVMNGNIRDTSGNPLQGNRAQGGHVISFTTGGDFSSGGGAGTSSGGFTFGAGDMKPPYVMGTIPFDGTMNVVPNVKINISFSDPMDTTSVTTSGNIKFYSVNNAGTATLANSSATLDTSQKIAIITPQTSLTAGKYKVVVTGALKSATGIFMGNPGASQNTNSYEVFKSYFEVGANMAADNTKPTIKGTWPAANATGIAVNPGALNIQFSEGMDPTTINATTITLKKGTSQVTGNVNYDPMSNSATFSPTVALTTDSAYTFTVVGSATATSTSVTDIVGNPLNANNVVTFTTASTGDTEAPKIMFANGDDYGIAITFSEPMNSAKITDSTNWASSTLKYSNYVIKYGPATTTPNTWTAITLTNASFNYDGNTNTVIIENLGLTPEQTGGGKDYYVDMSAAGVTDLSGNALATITTFQMPINSSSATMGMLGPSTGGGMTGGMMGPDMVMMGMMTAGASPMNAVAGKTTIYLIDIPTSYAVASGTKIVLTFPQGFDISGAKWNVNSPVNSDMNQWNTGVVTFGTAASGDTVGDTTTKGGAVGDGVVVDMDARTVTINLMVSGTTPTSDFLHLDIAGITNSSIPRDFNTSGYMVDIKILDSNNTLKETVSGMPFFLTEAGANTLDGTITLAGAATEDGTVNLYLGSPMTGPIDTAITITNGSGSYSIAGLPNGIYMFFTDPGLTMAGTSTEWMGLTMPEPISLTASTTKNFTFARQMAGSGLAAVTVNITGAFGTDDIDIFAGSPSGFRVKTLTDAGNNPTATLYLSDGDWMVGFGPAMPKGPMSGPPLMPDWMPPMPTQVKISGGGATITEGSGTANDGTIAFNMAAATLQIIGYVTDGVATSSYPNGTPIADTEVWAYQPMGGGMGSHAKTSTDGKFTLKLAQTGNYTVGASKPGLPGVPEKSVAVGANDSIDTGATDGNTTADITIDNTLITAANKFVFKIKKPAYTISGKLTDGVNAIPYAPVWAYQSNGYGHADTMTDASGNYILYVDNGAWVVNAYVPGYGDADSKTVVVSGSSMTQNMTPASTSNYYTVGGTITIGGSVQTNMPLRAVEFNSSGAYLGKEYHGSTNSSGAYSLSLPGTGSADSYKYYRIDTWTPTYGEIGLSYDEVAANPANIKISNAATTTADITITAGNLITATVSLTNKAGYANKEGFLNIDGVICSGATCKPSDFHKSLRLADISGTDQTVQLQASSKYFFSLDVPGVGKYMPDLNANTGRDSTTGSVIATTTARSVKFTLPDATTNAVAISGTVTDASANPVSNAWVWVGNPSTGYFIGTSTIANGAYSISVPIGTGYKTSAEKSGYMSGEPSYLNVSAAASKNFSLTASAYTISGYIYADANSNNSYDAGESVANGWVRAETTDGAKKVQGPTDGNGYFELGVVNGTWKIYGMANGYSESQIASNVTVSGSIQTNKNIKLTVDSNWTNKSTVKPITPASGGIVDDTASGGTGVKLTLPPNALGSSASAGNVTAAITNAVTETNSNEPFSNEGTKITAADNSGQAITNLSDYIDFEKVIYKSEVASEITAGSVTLAKLKTMQNGYWDSTSNDWVNLATTRTAYYKTNSNDTEWTLYADSAASDSFEAFIDTLISGTTYGDYKLVFTSKTNHLTIFAVIMPFVATPAAASPSTPPASSTPGGSVPTTANYCSDVTYDAWQVTCASGYQYRNILSRNPTGCVLTTDQENARKKTCGQTLPEIINEVKEEIRAITGTSSQAAAEFAAKVINFAADAAEIVRANVNGLLGKLGFKRDLAKESVTVKKYVKGLIKNVSGITAEKQNAITNFIAYGTETTAKLGEGERAGVLNSYKKAFGKLPGTKTEWEDAIKIANGRWPSQTSTTTLNTAKAEFKKIYKRDANTANVKDNAAVTIISYGLRPADRNTNSEKTAIKFFKGIYGHNPVSALAWDIIRAIAYSGAKR